MNANEEQQTQSSLKTHQLSIGLAIGLTIMVIGAIILLYGLFGHADYASHSLGININLIWGLVMVLFGLIMAGGSYLSRSRSNR